MRELRKKIHGCECKNIIQRAGLSIMTTGAERHSELTSAPPGKNYPDSLADWLLSPTVSNAYSCRVGQLKVI